MRADPFRERLQLIQWSLRVKREKLLEALGRRYYSIVEDPKFWLYAMLAAFVGAIVAGVFFKNEPLTGLAVGLFLIFGIWGLMADYDRQEQLHEQKEALLRKHAR